PPRPAAARPPPRPRRGVGGPAVPDAALSAQWRVVEASEAAARHGDFEALVAVLHPDVVLRADAGLSGLSQYVRGAEKVAGQALMWSRVDLTMRRALINGAPGVVTIRDGRPFSVGAFTVKHGKIVEMDFLADRERLAGVKLDVVDD